MGVRRPVRAGEPCTRAVCLQLATRGARFHPAPPKQSALAGVFSEARGNAPVEVHATPLDFPCFHREVEPRFHPKFRFHPTF
jgi:hypothetical protein